MSENKRVRVRAIIIQDDKLVVMYREFETRKFYCFPGGGILPGETEEECVIREVKEEFGITIMPIKKVYEYVNDINIEYFYICKYVSGKFGTGDGEEYDPNQKNGVYIPTLLKISDIPLKPLMPKEVAEAFTLDYAKYGNDFLKYGKDL